MPDGFENLIPGEVPFDGLSLKCHLLINQLIRMKFLSRWHRSGGTTCSKVKPQDPARDVDKIAPESILSGWLIILSSWPESGKGAFNIDK